MLMLSVGMFVRSSYNFPVKQSCHVLSVKKYPFVLHSCSPVNIKLQWTNIWQSWCHAKIPTLIVT